MYKTFKHDIQNDCDGALNCKVPKIAQVLITKVPNWDWAPKPMADKAETHSPSKTGQPFIGTSQLIFITRTQSPNVFNMIPQKDERPNPSKMNKKAQP